MGMSHTEIVRNTLEKLIVSVEKMQGYKENSIMGIDVKYAKLAMQDTLSDDGIEAAMELYEHVHDLALDLARYVDRQVSNE